MFFKNLGYYIEKKKIYLKKLRKRRSVLVLVIKNFDDFEINKSNYCSCSSFLNK